jgi:hypothetical protein
MATSLPQKNRLVLSMVVLHNQSAALSSVHKFSEKEKAMRAIGRRLSIQPTDLYSVEAKTAWRGLAEPLFIESVESHSGRRSHAQLCDGMMQSLFLSLNANRIINMRRGAGLAADGPSSARTTEQE